MRPLETRHSRHVSPGVRLAVVAIIAALVALAAACDESGVTSTSLDPADVDAGSRPVSFTTEDGVTLGGHLFGSGDVGIILAHMYPSDQTSWYQAAQKLVEEGYLVLTFDFRGYGESEGSRNIEKIGLDAIAAVNAIAMSDASRMVSRVVLVGASMGGTACLIAGDFWQAASIIQVGGVATLSAPVEFKGLSAEEVVPRLRIPMLFIAAEDDTGADGARELQELSGGTGDLQIVPGADHGTDLLKGQAAEQVWSLLLDFLSKSLTPTAR
jgi:uncharacterized protein